ncbi:hypothetical protein ACHAW5_010540 [Stephanodiscus triporus]|uniref:Uncharacterized protein n=1 Tax=Stephanodiscus triporus TaxID=2934178 RepID=A0ABD3P7X5_9STRA
MKLFTPFTSITALTASCVFVENVSARLLGGSQVVACVRVTGSDAGGCAAKDLPDNCDANYSLHADDFADGTVKGILKDAYGDGTPGLQAKIDCLKIIDNDGDKIAIASGLASTSSPEKYAGKVIYVGAKIDTNGKGYYSNSGNLMPPGSTCENVDYEKGDRFKWFEHATGVVKIIEV